MAPGPRAGTGHAFSADVEDLLRRASNIVAHYRFFNQPIDAREVVRRTLATQPQEKILQYRALLEEAVESLIRGFR